MEIEWREPPASALMRQRAVNSPYIEFAIALREWPERWAVLPVKTPYANAKSAQGAAQKITSGRAKAFAAGEYEAINAGTEVFVRFIGPQHEEEEPPPTPINRLDPETVKDIRAWAKANGIRVADRGALPGHLVDRYYKDTDNPRPPHLTSVT